MQTQAHSALTIRLKTTRPNDSQGGQNDKSIRTTCRQRRAEGPRDAFPTARAHQRRGKGCRQRPLRPQHRCRNRAGLQRRRRERLLRGLRRIHGRRLRGRRQLRHGGRLRGPQGPRPGAVYRSHRRRCDRSRRDDAHPAAKPDPDGRRHRAGQLQHRAGAGRRVHHAVDQRHRRAAHRRGTGGYRGDRDGGAKTRHSRDRGLRADARCDAPRPNGGHIWRDRRVLDDVWQAPQQRRARWSRLHAG